MTFAVTMEIVLVVSALAGLIAAVAGYRQTRHWHRVGWALIVVGFGWIVLGELILNLTGWPGLITRWARGVPARCLIVAGLWCFVWVGRRRGRR